MNLKKISYYISIASAIYVLIFFLNLISPTWSYGRFNSIISDLCPMVLFTLLTIFFYIFSKKIK